MGTERSSRMPFVEVIVVIGIVLLLLGLLLPSVQSSQAGYRSTCQNNLRQCSFALLVYQDVHRQFPGYANVIGGKRASWVVPVLPQLERNDLYQNWSDSERRWDKQSHVQRGRGSASDFIAPLEILICPSSAREGEMSDPLSYVVNSGSARTANDFLPLASRKHIWVEDISSGVFFNQAHADSNSSIEQPCRYPRLVDFSPDQSPVMTAKYIEEHDGLNHTLLMSENSQATNWATDPLNPGDLFECEFQIRQAATFVWFITGKADNALPVSASVKQDLEFDPQRIRINAQHESKGPPQLRFNPKRKARFGWGEASPGGLAVARPASNHAGGVNVTFCGGNGAFLSEDIDYRVFTQLMTPWGAEVVVDLDAEGRPIHASSSAGMSQRVATPWLGVSLEDAF